MTKRKKYIILLLAGYTALLTCDVINVLRDRAGLRLNGSSVLESFWEIQFGGWNQSMLTSTLTIALFTAMPAFLPIYLHNNHAFYNVQQRLGYRRFIISAVGNIFKYTALLSAFAMLYQLILIQILLRTSPSNVKLPNTLLFGRSPFNDNTLLSLAQFILLSAIGWGVFAVFVFTVGLFVKKTSIFLVLGVAIGIGLIVSPTLALPLMSQHPWIANVSYQIMASTLFAPGQLPLAIFNGNPPNIYLTFAITATLYAGSAVLIMRLWVKHRSLGGE